MTSKKKNTEQMFRHNGKMHSVRRSPFHEYTNFSICIWAIIIQKLVMATLYTTHGYDRIPGDSNGWKLALSTETMFGRHL